MTELKWQKSSYTEKFNCVEVARAESATFVRDSKNPDGGRLTFDVPSWHAFLTSVKRAH